MGNVLIAAGLWIHESWIAGWHFVHVVLNGAK
jgi:hypothetical protein